MTSKLLSKIFGRPTFIRAVSPQCGSIPIVCTEAYTDVIAQ